MLRRLTVRNLAIVEDLELELAEGLTVITGETGAGKSILVDAVSLVAGGRGSSDFIRDGAANGDRHRLLFSAAANLAEFDCPPKLAFALLMPSALDSGLAPADAARQVECGLKHAASQRGVP